jgi:hypothetical protein
LGSWCHGFVIDGQLRDVLGDRLERWLSAPGRLSGQRLLLVLSAEVQARVLIGGQDASSIEGELWRGGP